MFYENVEDAKKHLDEVYAGEPVVMIVWSREDITARLDDLGDNRDPSTIQLDEMLELMGNTHDANLGITWDTIDCAVDQVMSVTK